MYKKQQLYKLQKRTKIQIIKYQKCITTRTKTRNCNKERNTNKIQKYKSYTY